MPSEKSPQKRLIDAAADLGDQAYRRAYDHISSRTGASPRGARARPRGRASGPASAGVELAQDIAEWALHTATTVVRDLADASESLEKVVAGRRSGSPVSKPSGGRGAGTGSGKPAAAVFTPPALTLSSVSPGESTSSAVELKNDSLNTLDGIRLRCRGLFGPGDARISGRQVKFEPPTVDVAREDVASVMCTVTVPKHAKRGNYSGLIEAIDLTGVQLVASLDVV